MGANIGLFFGFEKLIVLFEVRAALLFEVRSPELTSNLKHRTLNKFDLFLFYVTINNYIYHGIYIESYE
jgi:hypothetical protein